MSKAFSPSYLEGTSEALPFLPLDFRQANDRKAAVEQAAQRPCDPRLVAILRRQNEFGDSHLQATTTSACSNKAVRWSSQRANK